AKLGRFKNKCCTNDDTTITNFNVSDKLDLCNENAIFIKKYNTLLKYIWINYFKQVNRDIEMHGFGNKLNGTDLDNYSKSDLLIRINNNLKADCDISKFYFEEISQEFFEINVKNPYYKAELVVMCYNKENRRHLNNVSNDLGFYLNYFFTYCENEINFELMFINIHGQIYITEYGLRILQKISIFTRKALLNKINCVSRDDIIENSNTQNIKKAKRPKFMSYNNIIIVVQDWFTVCNWEKFNVSKNGLIDLGVYVGLI
ncbi:hypothetical protein EDEG_04044, partial [Edhazardia aedis USNM 41457]